MADINDIQICYNQQNFKFSIKYFTPFYTSEYKNNILIFHNEDDILDFWSKICFGIYILFLFKLLPLLNYFDSNCFIFLQITVKIQIHWKTISIHCNLMPKHSLQFIFHYKIFPFFLSFYRAQFEECLQKWRFVLLSTKWETKTKTSERCSKFTSTISFK